MIPASSAFLAANANLAKQPVFVITIDGYSRAFYHVPVLAGGVIPTISGLPAGAVPWLIDISDHTVTVNDLDGGADLADLVFTVQDRGGAVTSDFPSFVFEGKKAQLFTGEVGMNFVDFALLFTGKISSVESANANTEYIFSAPDVRQELAKVIYTVGDDGYQTDSQHPRTLNGHPLDILISALQTEVGLNPSDIDIAKITHYRDTVYNGMQFEFKITSPPTAKDFIDNEIMKPLGAYQWSNSLGQVSANFYYPLNPAGVLEFNVDNLTDIPEAGQSDLINQVSMRFEYDDQGKSLAEAVSEDDASIAKYGIFGQHIIDAQGVRSGFQGFLSAEHTAFLIFIRYGDKQLCHGDSGSNASSNPISAIWSTCLVEPGDIVTQTNPHVPDRNTGTMGITGKTFVVMDRTWQFFAGLVQFKLLAVDLSKFTQYQIAADGAASYSSGQTQFMYFCNDSDQYSNGDPAHTLC